MAFLITTSTQNGRCWHQTRAQLQHLFTKASGWQWRCIETMAIRFWGPWFDEQCSRWKRCIFFLARRRSLDRVLAVLACKYIPSTTNALWLDSRGQKHQKLSSKKRCLVFDLFFSFCPLRGPAVTSNPNPGKSFGDEVIWILDIFGTLTQKQENSIQEKAASQKLQVMDSIIMQSFRPFARVSAGPE